MSTPDPGAGWLVMVPVVIAPEPVVHEAGVEEEAPYFWVPFCTCGWEGAAERTWLLADSAAEEHAWMERQEAAEPRP